MNGKVTSKLPMSKRELRKRLAALSFSDKVKILEKLRDRSLVLAASGLRRRPAKEPQRQSETRDVKD
ncbi:MAG: hypothetical protein DMG98_05055 [Acidobacteria bacterium]|nr:MAG: hypothetical protein DMG98_05055 [Acidobacteriota bacterium]